MPWLAGLAAVVGTGVSIAGAAGAFNPDAPDPINYGQITRDAQQAQIDLLPAKTAAHNLYDPQTLALQQNLSWANLFGTPAGTRNQTWQDKTEYTEDEYRKAYRVAFGTSNPADPNNKLNPSSTKSLNEIKLALGGPKYHYVDRTRTVKTDAAPGLIKLMQTAAPELLGLNNAAESSARTQGISDVKRLGPAALAAIKNYDPAAAKGYDTLLNQAQTQVDQNGQLDPFMRRSLAQNIRGAQSARGMGQGPADADAEGYYLTASSEERRRKNQELLSAILGQRTAWEGDPFTQILSRTSGRMPQVPYQASAGSWLTDPGNAPYSVAGQNQTTANQANIAGYNSQMSGMGALPGVLKSDSSLDWAKLFGRS
jgi:hypothetical protein